MKNIPFNYIVPAAIIAVLMFTQACKNTDNTMQEDPMDGPVVVLTTSMGEMKIKLYNATPKHRDNFVKLVNQGFYDGTRFHRVINGFMIQGGDPFSRNRSQMDEWGTGGPGYTIAAEFDTLLRHCKGAVAAARLGDMANPRRASSGSQFYIVQSERGCSHLDGQYTVFGQVVEGMELIDRIAGVPTDPYDRPLSDVTITKAVMDTVAVENPADSLAKADSVAAPADSTREN